MNTTTPNQFENLSAESSVDRMAVVTTEEVFAPTDAGGRVWSFITQFTPEDDHQDFNDNEANDYLNG